MTWQAYLSLIPFVIAAMMNLGLHSSVSSSSLLNLCTNSLVDSPLPYSTLIKQVEFIMQ